MAKKGNKYKGYEPGEVYDPTGIKDAVLHDQVVKTEFYDITGKQIAEPKSGLFIKKSFCLDGSVKTRKVVK